MRSRPRFFAALVALAAMLFAQAAFALAACDPLRATSRAHMIVAQEMQNAGCHEPADNANFCFAHCQNGDQTLDKHQVKVPDAPLHPLRLARPWQDVPQRVQFVLRVPFPSAAPPPRILFRSLLI